MAQAGSTSLLIRPARFQLSIKRPDGPLNGRRGTESEDENNKGELSGASEEGEEDTASGLTDSLERGPNEEIS